MCTHWSRTCDGPLLTVGALRPLRHLARGWPDLPPSVFTVWQSDLVPKTFDSDFYVVCATVIPVLFLAVAVQGSAYRAVLDAALKVRITNAGDGWRRKLIARVRARILQHIGYAIWCAGALGELTALMVLYQGHEQNGTRGVVFLCTALLVFTVAMGPLDSFIETRKKLDKWQDSQPEVQRSDNAATDSIAAVNSGVGWPEGEGQSHGDRPG